MVDFSKILPRRDSFICSRGADIAEGVGVSFVVSSFVTPNTKDHAESENCSDPKRIDRRGFLFVSAFPTIYIRSSYKVMLYSFVYVIRR